MSNASEILSRISTSASDWITIESGIREIFAEQGVDDPEIVEQVAHKVQPAYLAMRNPCIFEADDRMNVFGMVNRSINRLRAEALLQVISREVEIFRLEREVRNLGGR